MLSLRHDYTPAMAAKALMEAGIEPAYSNGKVIIIQGDCLEIMRQLPDNLFEATFTSPPYNQLGSRIPENPHGMHEGSAWTEKVAKKGYGDDMPEEAYQAWQKECLDEMARVTAGTVWYNHKLRYREGFPIYPTDWFGDHKKNIWAEVIWDRGITMALNAGRFAPCDERIYGIGKPIRFDQEFGPMMTVWQIPPERGIKGHPCPFPVKLPARCIGATTHRGGWVLEPFMGSGTTLLAAQEAGRYAIGIEMNKEYIDLAISRLGQETLNLFD